MYSRFLGTRGRGFVGRSFRRARATLVLAASVALLPWACIYDAEQRCDAHQHLGPGESCVCDEGFVFDGQTCTPCGDDEEYESGACVCIAGYARSGDQRSACVESGAGTSCDPTEADACQDPSYDVCRDRGGGIGYCSKGCEGDDECPHGYACDTTSTPATCMSSPVGQLAPCSSAADCEGKDATYCEVSVAKACLVQGCSLENPLSCSEGFGCCDLQSLGLALTLCVPEDMCPTAN